MEAFRRWYADPEIARLARYQQTPMRPEEIDRFFEARVVGPTRWRWRSTNGRRTA